MRRWVEIDGAHGEGGGQILRTALALSLVTGRPFRITRIRHRRSQPGLARQHLAGVRAAAAIGRAEVEGAALRSTELSFSPGAVRPGDYRFDIGTAGATSLLLHTVYLPLCLAPGPSTLVLTGGTHVPWSPAFEYLRDCWAPWLAAIGLEVRVRLERPGFYPPGGGRLDVSLAGAGRVQPAAWTGEADFDAVEGVSLQANLSPDVAERQAQGAVRVLQRRGIAVHLRTGSMRADSPGTVIELLARAWPGAVCFTALGERGKRAESVGREAAQAMVEQLGSGAPVDPYAADQLLLPLAVAEGPSAYLTVRATRHLTTNAAVIERFGVARVAIDEDARGRAVVHVTPRRPRR